MQASQQEVTKVKLAENILYVCSSLTNSDTTLNSYPAFRKNPPNIIKGTSNGGAIASAVFTEFAAVDITYPETDMSKLCLKEQSLNSIQYTSLLWSKRTPIQANRKFVLREQIPQKQGSHHIIHHNAFYYGSSICISLIYPTTNASQHRLKNIKINYA